MLRRIAIGVVLAFLVTLPADASNQMPSKNSQRQLASDCRAGISQAHSRFTRSFVNSQQRRSAVELCSRASIRCYVKSSRSGRKQLTLCRDKTLKNLTDSMRKAHENRTRKAQPKKAQPKGESARPAAALDARAIVGKWQSAPVLGQLGLIQTTVTFYQNRAFTMKGDFISFAQIKPDLEYFWIISNGTYSVVGAKITLDFDKTWEIQKMRDKGKVIGTPGPVRGRAQRQVAYWKDGKLMMKEVALERIK